MIINKANLTRKGALQWGNHPTKIILHHPEFNGAAEKLNEIMINDSFTMCGYHFYVRKDGSIWAMRPEKAIGAHCYGENYSSIGIAAEGNFMIDIMGHNQKQSIIELCRYLIKRYPCIKEIAPHKKYYNTDCPGINFPTDEIIEMTQKNIGQQFNANDECISLWNRGNKVRLIQQQLINLGYDVGYWGADGVFGKGTFEAVKKFQLDNGLLMDGIIGPMTWVCLFQIK